MKHPLTSKERRGLTAVAAAALLCIAGAFVFRSCQSRAGSHSESATSITVLDNDSVASAEADSAKKGNGKRARRAARKASSEKKPRKETVYPTREPLDEACD